MELTLGPESVQLRDSSRSYLDAYLGTTPVTGPDGGWDQKLWAGALELGWLSATSGDGGPVEAGVIACEVGRAAMPVPYLPAACAISLLALGGAPEQAGGLVERIESDGGVVALVLPAGRTPLLAAPDGGSGWVLDGGPMVVEFAAQATELLCVAVGPSGETVVLPVPPDTAGVTIEPAATIDLEPAGVVRFDGVRVPEPALVTDDATAAIGLGRLLRAAEMVGGAQRVLEMTAGHVNRRHQFGVPLSSFQAVQHTLANLAIAVDGALLTTWEGISLAALGRPFDRAAAVAPFVAGRAYLRAAVDGAQLHGGIGVSKEYPLHRYFQRAQGCRMRLGAQPDQLERIAVEL